jgi:Na+/proline symporter
MCGDTSSCWATAEPAAFAVTSEGAWLHGLPIDLVVLLAWVLLLGGPVLAGAIAARCYRGPGSPEQVQKAKIRQAVAAGFLATAAGALMVTVLGTVTIALMPRAAGCCPGSIRGSTCPRPSPTTMR